jgi:hypothetical protein
VSQALWGVLEAYHASEAAISAALSDSAAAKAAAPKKQLGSKDVAADPDDWLPGPSKYLLDAALRAASSLLNPAGSQQQQEQQQENAQHSADSCTEAAHAMHTWAAGRDVAALACLLQHPSARVQVGAPARLAGNPSSQPAAWQLKQRMPAHAMFAAIANHLLC